MQLLEQPQWPETAVTSVLTRAPVTEYGLDLDNGVLFIHMVENMQSIMCFPLSLYASSLPCFPLLSCTLYRSFLLPSLLPSPKCVTFQKLFCLFFVSLLSSSCGPTHLPSPCICPCILWSHPSPIPCIHPTPLKPLTTPNSNKIKFKRKGEKRNGEILLMEATV